MESFVAHPGAAHTRPSAETGEAGGTFPGRLPFMGTRAGKCPPPLRYSCEETGWFLSGAIRSKKRGERRPTRPGLQGLVSGRLGPDCLPDLHDQVLRSGRPALHPHDLLELSLELRPVQARRAVRQVVGETSRTA